jgi:PAS domain S-box-containing protein
VAAAPAEELLGPLLQGDFLLTDARGSVSRWGTSASRLFGWRSEDVIGRSVFDAVLASGGGEWRRHLEVGEGPSPTARVDASGKRDDGHKFPIELLFLPVLLNESLELSRLLEVVGSDLSPDEKIQRLRRDHPAALDSIVAAATDSRADTDDSRLAGLVVTYRPLGETPWTEGPPPAPAGEPSKPAAIGVNEEQLIRVGKLERAEEELREALERETGELTGSLERETGELKEMLAAKTEELRSALASEIAEVRAGVEREAAELREEAATAREELAAAREQLTAAREEAAAAREDAAAARAVADRAHALAEELHIDEEHRRRERVEAKRDAPGPTQAAAPDEPPARPPREGFDDAVQAMAVIGLDGRFEQLNPGFESLVGYTEHEFRRARWPSLVDADNLVEHRELLAKLAAGEVENARVETVYLHGQGLLVPVAGEIRLERDGDGAPSHTVLTVDA